jgi:DnaJ-class molecular chaperone
MRFPTCKGCDGEGYVRGEGLVPRTCEVCDGEGKKTPLSITVGLLVLTVVTTVAPIWFWLR